MKIQIAKTEDEIKGLGSEVDNFVLAVSDNGGSEFIQSSCWAKVMSLEESVNCICLKDSDNSILLSSYFLNRSLTKNASFLRYLYLPRGPLFAKGKSEDIIADYFKEIVVALSVEYRPIFLRFEAKKEVINSLRKMGWRIRKTVDLQPQKTLMIDLKNDLDQILSQMHQKTRYNIRLARKKGVEIKEAACLSSDKQIFEKDFADFWQLMEKTAKRDEFKIHKRNHYRNLLSGDDSKCIKLFFAEHKGKRIAAGIFSFCGNKATYLHGASDSDYRSLMAPYLLQFEMMTRAKEKGFLFYDFFGVDKKKWPGVTRFKNGFGGYEYEYAGTYDYIYNPFLYCAYNIARRVIRYIR